MSEETWTYLGRTVRLNDRHAFEVRKGDEEPVVYASWREAEAAIDAQDALVTKITKTTPLGLRFVVAGRGGAGAVAVTVNGVHLSQGIVTGKGPDGKSADFDRYGELYPDTPAVRDALDRIADLQRRASEISATLPSRVRANRHFYGGRTGAMASARYEETIAELKKEHAEALKEAEEAETKIRAAIEASREAAGI